MKFVTIKLSDFLGPARKISIQPFSPDIIQHSAGLFTCDLKGDRRENYSFPENNANSTISFVRDDVKMIIQRLKQRWRICDRPTVSTTALRRAGVVRTRRDYRIR